MNVVCSVWAMHGRLSVHIVWWPGTRVILCLGPDIITGLWACHLHTVSGRATEPGPETTPAVIHIGGQCWGARLWKINREKRFIVYSLHTNLEAKESNGNSEILVVGNPDQSAVEIQYATVYTEGRLPSIRCTCSIYYYTANLVYHILRLSGYPAV